MQNEAINEADLVADEAKCSCEFNDQGYVLLCQTCNELALVEADFFDTANSYQVI